MSVPNRILIWLVWGALASGLPPTGTPGAQPAAAGGAGSRAEIQVIRGRVTDPGGRPVAGARVLGQWTLEAMKAHQGRYPWRSLSGETDDAGAFRLEVDNPGPFRIRVLAPGYLPADLDSVKPGGEGVAVRLAPGSRLAGRLMRSEDGEPLSGGEVVACDAGLTAWGEPGCHRASSDEEGRFAVDGLPEGVLVLRIRAPGRAAIQIRLPFRAGGKDVRVPLSPGGVLAGRVVDGKGRPVKGARAEVRVLAMQLPRPDWLLEPDRTDEQGRFRFEGVPAGVSVLVQASGKGLLPARSAPMELRGGEVRPGIELVLRSGGWARVRLVDADHRTAPRPAVEARVRDDTPGARHRLPNPKVQAILEDTGDGPAYRIGPFPPGRYRVVLRHDDYQDVTLALTIPGEGAVVDLGAVRVSRGEVLEGRVVDLDHRPVAGAVVTARQEDAPSPRARSVRTDDEGRFSVPGWAGDRLALEVRAPGFSPWRRGGVEPGAGPVRVVLEPVSSVEFTLRDEAGRAIRNRPYRAAAYAVAEDDPESAPAPAWSAHTRGSSKDGRVVLEDVPAGRYRIRAVALGYLPAYGDVVEVPRGGRVRLGAIVLKRGADLRGRVVDGEGRSVASASVSLERPGPLGSGRRMFRAGDETILTDDAGEFVLEGVEAGPCRIKAHAEGYSPASVMVHVPEERAPEPLVVTLARGGTIRGTVRDPQGVPVPDTGVTLLRMMPPEMLEITRTDADGWFSFRHVAPGRYQVLAESASDDPLDGPMKPVRVREGETVEVHLGGTPPIRVWGRVLRSGRAVPGVRLLFIREGSGGLPSGFIATAADGEGHYEVGLDEPGEYAVGVTVSDGGAPATEQLLRLVVPDEPEVHRDLVLGGGGLAGVVADPDGNPVAGATVRAQPVSQAAMGLESQSRAVTGEDGRFALTGLAAGAYVVEAAAEGFGPGREGPVTVEDGATAEVRLVLAHGTRVMGRVVSPEGRPIPGAAVLALRPGPALEPAGEPVATDAGGRFELDLATGRAVRLVAVGTPYAPGSVDVDAPETLARPLTITLREGASLSVRYTDRSGRPAGGGSLEIRSDDPLASLVLMISGQFQAVAGPDGVAVVRGLPAGTYTVRGLEPETPPVPVRVPPSGRAEARLSPGR